MLYIYGYFLPVLLDINIYNCTSEIKNLLVPLGVLRLISEWDLCSLPESQEMTSVKDVLAVMALRAGVLLRKCDESSFSSFSGSQIKVVIVVFAGKNRIMFFLMCDLVSMLFEPPPPCLHCQSALTRVALIFGGCLYTTKGFVFCGGLVAFFLNASVPLRL